MYNLTDINDIKYILKKHHFGFSKSLGQNFLIDKSIVEKIAMSSFDNGLISDVLEIGPGIGTLTAELAKLYKKVVSVEIDRSLLPILGETLTEQNNIKIINSDILKLDINNLIAEEFEGKKINVAANLPYYITSPVIMHLLESRSNINTITVMIQKEVAARLTAKEGTKDYGAITLAVNYYAETSQLFDVPPSSFIPAPKVTSTVIRLKIKQEKDILPLDEKQMFMLIKASFAQRRKTLINALYNSLSSVFSKELLTRAIENSGFDIMIRGEKLSLKDFCALSDYLTKNK